MKYALISICSAAVTAYFTIPVSIEPSGGYHFGIIAIAIASLIAAVVIEVKEV